MCVCMRVCVYVRSCVYAYVLGRACENFLNEVPPIYPGPVRIDRIAFATDKF